MSESVYTAKQAEENHVEETWGSVTWVACDTVGNAQGLTVGRVTIKPGCCNPKHRHRGCEEVFHVLEGRIEHTFDDERFALEPGDTIIVPPGVAHNAHSVGDRDAVMIVAFSSATRDAEPV
jgi:quercetin dioxygenase-like cupin family protein